MLLDCLLGSIFIAGFILKLLLGINPVSGFFAFQICVVAELICVAGFDHLLM